MSNRAQRRGAVAGHQFFRIIPIVPADDGDGRALPLPVQDASSSLIVDAREIRSACVVRVPFETSLAQAQELRDRMEAFFAAPVLVTTANVEFCRITRASPAEAAEILKRYVRPPREAGS